MRLKFLLVVLLAVLKADAQTSNSIHGKVFSDGTPVPFVHVGLSSADMGAESDSLGNYIIKNVPDGKYRLETSFMGYENFEKEIQLKNGSELMFDIVLIPDSKTLNEIVVTGVTK